MNLPVGPGTLAAADGAALAFRRTEGSAPGVIYLHGYRSDMNSVKALALEAWCRERGRAFVRFDLSGHGASAGDLATRTIGCWVAEAIAVVDTLADGPQVLVGSSMGCWLGLLVALARPDAIAGLVGSAAAPDFTEDQMWAQLSPDRRQRLLETGATALPYGFTPDEPWRITRAFIEDGRKHLVLRGPINVRCSVRLIHGQLDPDVPWSTALRIADSLTGSDVEVLLVKDGDHRLQRDHDLARLTRVVEDLLRHVSVDDV